VNDDIIIRPGRPDDAPTLHRQMADFAAFEKLSHVYTITLEEMRRDFLSADARISTLIAEKAGLGIGFLLYYPIYASTFRGIAGLFVEDLWVDPAYRQRGLARRLLAEVARIGKAGGRPALCLSALDWNENARRLYRDIGFVEIKEWIGYRLTGEAFEKLANESG